MTYCPNCGSALEAGSICSCQRPQPPQYQQQQPYQQPYGMPMPVVSPKPPGRTMIKVVGILMTIFGGCIFFANISNLTEISDLKKMMFISDWVGKLSSLIVYEMIVSMFMVAFGICGIVMASKREKASIIMGFGITLIALTLGDLGWGFSILNDIKETAGIYGVAIAESVNSTVVANAVFGCVLPILYIVGGSIRKKASQ